MSVYEKYGLLRDEQTPGLFLRHEGETLILVPNTHGGRRCLRRLATILGVDVPALELANTLVIYQDEYSFNARSSGHPFISLHAYFKGKKSQLMADDIEDLGYAGDDIWPISEDIKNTVVFSPEVETNNPCGSCFKSLQCDMAGGPSKIGEYSKRDPGAGFQSDCPHLRFLAGGRESGSGTDLKKHFTLENTCRITKEDLVDADITLLKSPQSLDRYHGHYGMSRRWGAAADLLGEADMDTVSVNKLIESGEVEIEKAFELDKVWYQTRVVKRAPRTARPHIDDLDWSPENIRANQVMMRLRALVSGKKAGKSRSFRAKECSKCAYDCSSVPDQLPSNVKGCHVNEDIIVESNKHLFDLDHLSMFTMTGRKARFVMPDGTKRWGIGFGPHPDNPTLMIIKALRPPFESLGELPIDEYLRQTKRESWSSRHEQVSDDANKRAMAFWACTFMAKQFRWDASLSSDGGEQYHRNDVLYIHVNRRLDSISVGSDTRASTHGGMNVKGDPIKMDDRPRFYTYYNYPYFADIQICAGMVPGSGRGLWGWNTKRRK